ncbi:zinc ribbon-containing protein [Pseudoalteromonas sp. JBTF-M23]|uniref:Zinc ribbon-containing protein n=1 Tax=Pseudoalteromonas caenipelagi TaxID=2726988 RepID=A0A849VFP9_9GAMM|nr:zinc ribbon-containing protein [Pseudoalteromonas caenipelagi]NOU52549.1 zinc ribbon-containing protein [Pseudoalteromonas caenipelagi]
MSSYKAWLGQFIDWVKDVKEHEVDDLVEKFIEHQQALKDFSQEKLQTYKHYLSRDLAHLKKHKSDYDDLAWEELKASIWYELSQLEDRTQLEWQALVQDFNHKGTYKSGEWIAMGQLVCKNCGNKLDVFYASEIMPCSECGHNEFMRKALSP